MVLVQKWAFFQLFFLGNISQENVFYDILERNNPFLSYRNKKFKKSKNWHFSNGVKSWFCSKNGHFSNFFFRKYKSGKCLLWYSRTKKRLSKLLKQEVQKVEKMTFFQRVNPWFWSKKWLFFQFFSLGNIGQEKVFYDILERKNAFLGYKNKKFKKSKNWHFSMFFVKKSNFWSYVFFFCKLSEKISFFDILYKKESFIDQKI